MFAKIFQSDEFGQILAKLDSNSDYKPEVRYWFVPKGLGVCSAAISMSDTNEGWDAAEKVFEQVDIVTAEKFVNGILKELDLD